MRAASGGLRRWPVAAEAGGKMIGVMLPGVEVAFWQRFGRWVC